MRLFSHLRLAILLSVAWRQLRRPARAPRRPLSCRPLRPRLRPWSRPVTRPIRTSRSPVCRRRAATKPAVPQALQVDPVADLIARVEKEYQAGQDNYRAGHLEAAKQNFDSAFNQLLGSGFDLARASDDRLEHELDRILDGINGLELAALQQGDGFAEQKSEPAPIDEANELTPAVDQKVKAKAEAEIKVDALRSAPDDDRSGRRLTSITSPLAAVAPWSAALLAPAVTKTRIRGSYRDQVASPSNCAVNSSHSSISATSCARSSAASTVRRWVSAAET